MVSFNIFCTDWTSKSMITPRKCLFPCSFLSDLSLSVVLSKWRQFKEELPASFGIISLNNADNLLAAR